VKYQNEISRKEDKFMSMINLFLQKRKMHESQHGVVMVITAYALSVLLLILGSDVFYNISSTAAGMSQAKVEETQEKINEELPDLQSADLTALLIQSKLQSPFGIAEVTETGLGSIQAEELYSKAVTTEDNAVVANALLFGNTMSSEEYAGLIEQATSLNSISAVVKAEDTILPLATSTSTGESADAEIFSLSTQETLSSYVFDITEEEIDMLERIVQAEAGGEDMIGRILIANVIMNRIEDEKFPDTVEDVIFQNKDGEYQFSPVDDERYWSVDITDKTEEAVQRALEGEDYSEGALYFIARKRTNANSAEWFDQNLKWLFKHGGHEFYREK
jgi:N-acetylmuramoyl-L-alanine amidase